MTKVSPRTVLRVIDRLNIGGPAIHVTLLSYFLDLATFTTHRWRTVLVYGQEAAHEGNMHYLLKEKSLTSVYMPLLGRELHPLRDLVSLAQMIRLILKERPAVVHTHKSKAGVIGRLAAWLSRVPVRIHTYHGHVLHGYFGPMKSRLFIWIERIMGRLSTHLIAVSPKVKADLVRYGIAPEEKIKVLYLGLDLEKFSRTTRGHGTLRRELNLSPGHRLVGIVARLVPIKGVPVFLEAAKRIASKEALVDFIIAGDGELREALEKASDSMGLRDRVHFLGFRSDVENLYPDIDVLTLTSHNEGSPVSLIEGLASGCAVVATEVGGVSDVIENGETGYLVPYSPLDSPALTGERVAEKVLSLLRDPAERQRLGEKGQKDVINRFDIQRLVLDIDRLYCSSFHQKDL